MQRISSYHIHRDKVDAPDLFDTEIPVLKPTAISGHRPCCNGRLLILRSGCYHLGHAGAERRQV